jgi:hypothetical protein
MMADKNYYLAKAAEMRALAGGTRVNAVRDHFHRLALEYERLADDEPVVASPSVKAAS